MTDRKQHVHILGICGTFMGSLAQLAVEAGFRVTGCDKAVYPPMSTQLEACGIELIDGFGAEQLGLKPDVFIVGNVVSRGNPLMEAILDAGLAYTSGPQWFAEHILRGRWVLGVAGTHGKTTTSSMLTWILEYAGFKPGYLIGGVPLNFECSARLGGSDFFVVEADEYDTAFFDKRSKFIHYHIRTLIMNNLEFDHADIFPDLAAIQRQFHHLVRTVPQNGLLIHPDAHSAIDEVLAMGCWTERQSSSELSDNAVWSYRIVAETFSEFEVLLEGEVQACVAWDLDGRHNIENGLHAVAAARHIGIAPSLACEALSQFSGVKRRLERVGEVGGVTVYDDFAHHPTAIQLTLEGLRRRVGDSPIVAVIEPRSNTMALGVHKDTLKQSAAMADRCFWFDSGGASWGFSDTLSREDGSAYVFSDMDALIQALKNTLVAGSHCVVMSNGGFGGLPKRLVESLQIK